MNILLANLYWDYGADHSLEKMKHLHFPLGLAIIAGEIQKNRKDKLFVIDNYVSTISATQILDFINNNKIECVLLSQYLGNYQYRYLKRFVNVATKVSPTLKVIIGGPLASTIPGILLENCIVDKRVVCVIGEGEETIIDLLGCIETGGNLYRVKGIAYKDGGVVYTPIRPRISDLDRHARPAYDIFETQKYVNYVKAANRCWEIIATRGCYGSCVFCKLAFGEKITKRSASSIVKEMEDFYISYGVRRFNFVDDDFLNSKQQVRDFCNTLEKSNQEFIWRFQARANRLYLELMPSLLEVGLFDVSLGIESGSPLILKEMHKEMDLKLAEENIKSLPPQLNTHGSFIVGMPSESHFTIEQTLKFIDATGLQHASAGILTLFPGTSIYEMAKDNGIITDEDKYCDNLGPVYVKPYTNLTLYSDEQLLQWMEMINSAGSLKGAIK